MTKIIIPPDQKLEILKVALNYKELFDTANDRYSIWINIFPSMVEVFHSVAETIMDQNEYFNKNVFVDISKEGTREAFLCLRSGNNLINQNITDNGFQFILQPLLNGLLSFTASAHSLNKDAAKIVYQSFLEPEEVSPHLLCNHIIEAFRTVQRTSYLNAYTS